MLLGIAMLVGCMPSVFAYRWDRDPECPDFSEVIWQSTESAADGFTGNPNLTEDDERGTVWSLGGTTYLVQMIKEFTEEEKSREYFNDNRMLFSIDICPKQTNHTMILALNNEPVLLITGQGKMSYLPDAGWVGSDYSNAGTITYEANTWYNIKILFDANLKKVTYWRNGELWGSTGKSNAIFFDKNYYPDLTMEHFLINYNAYESYYDGVKGQSHGDGVFLIDNVTYGYPKLVDVTLEGGTDELGNMLVEGDTDLYLKVLNHEAEDKKLKLEYEIRDAENYSYVKDSIDVDVKSDEEKRIDLTPELTKKGFYYIDAKLTDGDTVIDTVRTRFSVIAKSEQNPNMGFATGTLVHGQGSLEESVEIIKKLGGGLMREDYVWVGYLQRDGLTPANNSNITSKQKWFNYTLDNNINTMMILSAGPSGTVGVDYNPRQEILDTTDFLQRMENYAKNLAEDIGGGSNAVYEIFNEWYVMETLAGSGSGPEEYAQCLKAAVKGLRAGNPDCVIVGLCNGNPAEGGWDDRVLTALGPNPGQWMDAISGHWYMPWADFYPETSKLEDLENYRKMLAKYGMEDIPLYCTEFGCTTVNDPYAIDDSLQADYMLREFSMLNKEVEKNYFYTTFRKRDSVGREAGFGIMRYPNRTEIPYEALPGAICYAMWNSLMNGAEYIGEKIADYGNEEIEDDFYSIKYKLADGRDLVGVWNVKTDRMMSLDFGADTVTVYDRYGNPKTVNAVDGYITLDVTDEPIFVAANRLNLPEIRESALFEYDRSITTLLNNSGKVNVKNNSAKNLTVEIEPSKNIEPKFSGELELNAASAGEVQIKTSNDRKKIEEYMFDSKDGSYDGMRVILKDGDRVVFNESVKVKYEDSLDLKFDISPYKNGRWMAVASVRNTNREAANDGTLEILQNDKVIYSRDLKGVASGEKKIFRYIVPEELVGDSLKLTARISATDGQVFEKTAENKLAVIMKAPKAPTIDGKFDVGEWQVFSSPLKVNTADYAKFLAAWKGPDDLSADVYLMYDDKYLYMGAKVKDDIHYGSDEQGRIWAMDSIQFAVTDARVGNATITELGMALTDDGAKFTRYLSQHLGEEGFEMEKFEDAEFEASLDGNITTYEFKISWEDLFAKHYVPTESLIFSILINENDGKGRVGWMEYGGGIGTAKNVMEFLDVPLMK